MAQGVNVVRAEQVVAGAIGLLQRKVILPQLVWRDPGGSFVGAKNDTVTLSVPAYTNSRSRVMRSNTAIIVDDLDETSVDIKLDTHVYKAVGITDEQMTLDITNFGQQVLQPVTDSVARGIENVVVAKMVAAPYDASHSLELDADDPWRSLVRGRTVLNKSNVPAGDRFLAVGADVEEVLLNDEKFIRTDFITSLGSTDALTGATIGKIAGIPVISVPGLDPDHAVMAHKTAFALSLVAPVVPAGAPWGTVASYSGYTLRALRDYEPQATNGPRDRLLSDVFAGCDFVGDRGVIDGQGVFQPDAQQGSKFVRAVKFVLEGQS